MLWPIWNPSTHVFLSPSRFGSVEGLVRRTSVGAESNRLSNLMLKLRSSPALPSQLYSDPADSAMAAMSNVHCPLSIVHPEVTFSCQTALVGLWHLRVKTLIGRTRNRQSHRHRGFEPELKILFVSIRANPHRCKEIYASRSTCLAQVSAFVNVTAHMFKSDESISCAACY